MKVLFLDFDGVITYCNNARYGSGKRILDKECLARVHEVIERTGCNVVISSSWRHGHTLEWLSDFLGLDFDAGVIIGKTPGQGQIFTHDSGGRGTAITAWLALCGERVDRWAVIDDDVFDMHPWMLSRIVQTESHEGITDEHVEELVALLGEV